jgi:hypothetical protein
VSGRVGGGDRPIPAFTDDPAAPNEHSANRHLSTSFRLVSQAEGETHEARIFFRE